jgi:hypothetical protein
VYALRGAAVVRASLRAERDWLGRIMGGSQRALLLSTYASFVVDNGREGWTSSKRRGRLDAA